MWFQYHSAYSPVLPHAGTEYRPQWMKMPNFASQNHCGQGRLSSDSHFGSNRVWAARADAGRDVQENQRQQGRPSSESQHDVVLSSEEEIIDLVAQLFRFTESLPWSCPPEPRNDDATTSTLVAIVGVVNRHLPGSLTVADVCSPDDHQAGRRPQFQSVDRVLAMAFDDPSMDDDLRRALNAHEIVLDEEWPDIW